MQRKKITAASPTQMSFLKFCRLMHKLKQGELAEKIERTRQSVVLYETLKVPVSDQIADRLSEIFGIAPDSFQRLEPIIITEEQYLELKKKWAGNKIRKIKKPNVKNNPNFFLQMPLTAEQRDRAYGTAQV